jgi:hypothetical protein
MDPDGIAVHGDIQVDAVFAMPADVEWGFECSTHAMVGVGVLAEWVGPSPGSLYDYFARNSHDSPGAIADTGFLAVPFVGPFLTFDSSACPAVMDVIKFHTCTPHTFANIPGVSHWRFHWQ